MMKKRTIESAAVVWMERTPVGPLRIGTSEKGISFISFADPDDFHSLADDKNSRPSTHSLSILEEAIAQLQAYFNGALTVFDLPLDLGGLTDFTRKILGVTAAIPYGSVITYGELAEQAGSHRGARAVGGAMRRNPIPIVIPCHRVISSTRMLHGYSARGGLAAKAKLLELEGLTVDGENVLERSQIVPEEI
jgi:methylated-DNA-[protein]-cysteine S-methyltransferase